MKRDLENMIKTLEKWEDYAKRIDDMCNSIERELDSEDGVAVRDSILIDLNVIRRISDEIYSEI